MQGIGGNINRRTRVFFIRNQCCIIGRIIARQWNQGSNGWPNAVSWQASSGRRSDQSASLFERDRLPIREEPCPEFVHVALTCRCLCKILSESNRTQDVGA